MTKIGTTEKLILMILSRREWTPAGEIVNLLGRIRLSEGAVRATIFRLRRKGMVRGVRKGRIVCLAPADRAKSFLGGYSDRLARSETPWKGKWLLFSFNIPEAKRPLRNVLRERLQAMGFGRLHANLWIAPFDLREECAKWVAELGVGEHTALFITESVGENPKQLASRVWKLNALATLYSRLVKEYSVEFTRFRASGYADDDRWAAEGLVRLLKLKERLTELIVNDPYLPKALLPSDWPGFELRRVITAYSLFLRKKASLRFDYDLGPPKSVLKRWKEDRS